MSERRFPKGHALEATRVLRIEADASRAYERMARERGDARSVRKFGGRIIAYERAIAFLLTESDPTPTPTDDA